MNCVLARSALQSSPSASLSLRNLSRIQSSARLLRINSLTHATNFALNHSSPQICSRSITTSARIRGAKNIFEEDEIPYTEKKKKTEDGKSDEEEDEESFDSADDEDDGGPLRKLREVKMEPYNVDEVTKMLREMKATDIVVIDISEKVNWVTYMIYATGRSKGHIKSMANSLVTELKMRRPGKNWRVDQKTSDFWKIVNSGDILVNLFTEEEREEYDLERTWILRRDERNPFRADFDEEEESRWIYDEDEEGFMMDDDPEIEKIKGFGK